MVDQSDTKNLKKCFNSIISEIKETIDHLRHTKSETQSDSLHQNASMNTGVYTFTINENEEKSLEDLQENIQTHIDTYQAHLSKICKRYLFEYLNQFYYDEEQRKFSNAFTMDSLYPFEVSLRGALASIDAFVSAWEGQLQPVKDFVQNYPTLKDKPGLHGTTLLFSAARNNHMKIVQYLVVNAHCAVNAQNLQELTKALYTTTGNGEFLGNPSAASTALHGACFYGHLEIVKYLIEHGADYFIENQARETPIRNGLSNGKIRSFFEDFLILGYSKTSEDLPDASLDKISYEGEFDCLWEYKSLSSELWKRYTKDESQELSKSLRIDNRQEMKEDIYLEDKSKSTIYKVSLKEFCQSNKNADRKSELSWVRCRGSSIWNFELKCEWQLMIIKHNSSRTINEPNLEAFDIPKRFDNQSKFQLNSWYNCTAQISAQLDKAINLRKKRIEIDVDFISNGKLTFDLYDFSFENTNSTISGYIRWIPFLPSRSKRKLERKMNPSTVDDEKADDFEIDENEDDFQPPTRLNADEDENDDDDDDDHPNKRFSKDKEKGRFSLYDLQKSLKENDSDDDNKSIMSEGAESVNLDECLNETSDQSRRATTFDEKNSILHREEMNVMKAELEEKIKANEELKVALNSAKEEMQRKLTDASKRSEQDERKFRELSDKINKLNESQKRMEEERANNEQMERSLRNVDYTNIQPEIVQDFLTPKFYEILDHLKSVKTQFGTKYSMEKILKMQFREISTGYTVTIHGFQEHHDAFKEIVTRIRKLLNLKSGAIDFHKRKLIQKQKLLKKNIFSVKQKGLLWKQYSKTLIQLLDDKSNEFIKVFSDYIQRIARSLSEKCISNDFNRIRSEIFQKTNEFMEKNLLIKEIETLKHQAFEEFVKQNINFQRDYHEKKPSKESVEVLQKLIEKVRTQFQNNSQFIGYTGEHFSLIPNLLQQVVIYHSCFKIQLPLFESALDLLNKIETSSVTTVATSTGSGKSSLLPALLVAEGYDKIIVTQPRRLPCQLICDRVNSTMTPVTDPHSPKIAGWAVSGSEHNQNAKILYLTDGLLKERLLHDENFVTQETKVKKSIVFFLDEVHERSVNIDHCLALLARTFQLNPHLKSKVKLIISSATLDESVPKLFRQIKNLKCSQFEMIHMGTRFPVNKVSRPNANILNIVQELYQERRRNDQILCFVSSVKEVNEYCTLIKKITGGAITAYPLIQSQQASVQQEYIENKAVFFSTTVAETSLTFPQLKYVVDTGMINIPVYDENSKRTILRAERAAESTIKQRLGRLGRTQPGTYYSLYNFRVEDKKYPTPQICQSDLMSVEFSLLKSPLKQGLSYFKEFLPNPPSQKMIDHTIQQLIRLDILENGSTGKLTNHGKALAKLPDFGSLAMSKCVLAALKDFNCGADLIVLSSILGVLNTTTLLKSIPSNYKTPDGDFMTLLNVMNEILVVRQSVPTKEFNLEKVCKAKGLDQIKHILRQALRRYNTLEKSFNLSVDYRTKAQVKSNDWELIAKSLLFGYYDNVFASGKELNERSSIYFQYNGTNEDNTAEIDAQSVLGRKACKTPPPFILVRDIRYSTSVRSKAILSFIGAIKPEWAEHSIKRQFKINSAEEQHLKTNNRFSNALSKFSNRIKMSLNPADVSLTGSVGTIFDSECFLLNEMMDTFTFKLENKNPPGSSRHTNLSRNLESVIKMPNIFNPMKWRWENEKQVKITVNCNTSTNTCEITVNARNSDYQNVKREFDSFLRWLQDCAVIRHPNSGVPPRVFRPQVRSKYLDVEKRIALVTDPERSAVDLYNAIKGASATRETRMEAVAWIAVCTFHCRVEGGFVRDWVVGKYVSRPATPKSSPKDWISYSNGLPCIDKEVVPSDLDCHLPTHHYFDIERFHDELYKYDITVKTFRQDWRYVLLIDENASTGPFTMDLIEPHVALTHDRIDFDINNLSLERDYTHELGMRVDIQQRPYLIELETIVENIKNKRFQVLRPIDSLITERVNKMVNIRKWTQVGQPFSVIPNPNPKYASVLVPLPRESVLYKNLEQKMKTIGNQVAIVSMEQVKNPLLEDAYESLKKIIARQCSNSNPNERELFHGTKGPGIDGIRDDGFDDRYFSAAGNWGHGAYFADDPKKSHGYTSADANGERVMYYNKVILGNESKQTATNTSFVSAPQGFHSVVGTLNGFTEYIVYRYGQALPYIKMIYRG